MASDKNNPEKIIAQWTERDLGELADTGGLEPAFGVDDLVDELTRLIGSEQIPVVAGDRGVGKTAIIHEMIRRAQSDAHHPLHGKRVLAVSFRHRGAAMAQPHNEMRPAVQKLVEVLGQMSDPPVLVFSDLELFCVYRIETVLMSLASREDLIIIGESNQSVLQEYLDESPELHQQLSLVEVSEPTLPLAKLITAKWADHIASDTDVHIDPDAQSEAVYLAHRFLARTRMPRKVIDLLRPLAAMSDPGQRISRFDVIDAFCTVHRIPRMLVDPRIPLDLPALEADFASSVLGQDQAVRAVVSMIGMVKAGLSDMRRPFGVFLFVGPTGVGKTHVAQLLADYLFGSKDRVIRLNMADYPDPHSASVLFGDPNAYQLSQKRGTLTKRVMGHPFAVLLLDEFEKAHTIVHDRCLQLFDEGAFINGAGEMVSCRSMIIIATSNAGAEVYRQGGFGFNAELDTEGLDRELDRRLQERFRFEFLNRFDRIVHFHPLSRADIRQIARRELEQLEKRTGLSQRRIALEVDDAVLDWLAVHGYDADYGARFLRRVIERSVTSVVADAIVRRNPPLDVPLTLQIRGNKIVAHLPAAVEPTPDRQTLSVQRDGKERAAQLSPDELTDEAKRILSAARRRLEALDQRKHEHSQLLDQINAQGFYERADRASVLDAFRELDVMIEVERRLAGPIRTLEGLRGHTQPMQLARWVERAGRSLKAWDTRLAEEGAARVWLSISEADPLHPNEAWVKSLCQIEMSWCQALGLSATVAAYEIVEGNLNRAVLHVEGPGAASLLKVEHGIHRRTAHGPRGGRRSRCRVDVIEQSTKHEGDWPKASASGKRTDPLHLRPAWCGVRPISDLGISIELLGLHRAMVEHAMVDLSDYLTTHRDEPATVARVYDEDGQGARDPRTDASVASSRSVRHGQLHAMLEAFRAAQASS